MTSDPPPTSISGQGNPPFEIEFRAMGQLLREDAKLIMERWFERATNEQIHANPKERTEVMDDLLQMVQTIGARLQEQSSDASEEATQTAREHGRQRAHYGWDIVNMVKDYEILHGVVLEHLGTKWGDRLTYRQSAVLVAVLHRATGSAVEAYNESVQQKMKEQLHEQRSALRRLTFDLTNAEHRERQRIAQTLHDDFQQVLVATQMKVHLCLKSASPERSDMEEANQLLNQMLQISRNVTADLHPSILETEDLPAALRWLGGQFARRFNLEVIVDTEASPQLDSGPMPLRRLVYDSIRELLFNVVKHGKTDRAWLKICCGEGSRWSFEIEDRGPGFSPSQAVAVPGGKTSLGLIIVRRRIEEIGGTVEVDSQPGRGTRIVLTVPVEWSA